VRANDATRVFRAPNPVFTASYAGFVVGEGPGSLSGTLAFSTTATTRSARGSYPITPSGLSSTNYAIAFVDGVLNVTSRCVERASLVATRGARSVGATTTATATTVATARRARMTTTIDAVRNAK